MAGKNLFADETPQPKKGKNLFADASTIDEDQTPSPEPSGMTRYKLPSTGAMVIQRPDKAVYIKESDDPRFKGQEGWKYLDEKSGVFVPAPAEDTSGQGWLERNLGAESWKNLGRNVALGVTRPAEAILGLGHQIARATNIEGEEGYQKAMAGLSEQERYRQAMKNQGGGAAQLLGEALPTTAMMMAAPGAAPTQFATGTAMAPTVAPFAQRAAAAALPAAATSYLTTPGTPTERAKAAATAGIATPLVMGGIEKGVVPAMNVIGRGAGWVESKLPASMQALQDTADKYGIKLTAGDLSKKIQALENKVSRVPLSGMDDVRAAQQIQGQAAAEAFVEKLKSKVRGSGTPSEIAMTSGRRNAAADNAVGHEIYDAGAKLAGKAEPPAVTVIGEMEKLVNDEARKNAPSKALIDDLNTRIARLQETPSGVAARQLEDPSYQPMDKSYQGLKDLASEFWKESKRFDVGTPEHALYSKLSSAARKDLEDFANKSGNPELKSVTDLANNWWKNKVKAYSPDSQDYAAWAKQLRGKDLDPENVMKFFDQAGQDGKAKYFFNGLDDNGRAAVRWGIADRAMGKATTKGPMGDHFSPAAFASEIDRQASAHNIFFKGQDKWELDGFRNLMRAVERAGSAHSTIATGWGASTGLMGAAELTGAASALATGNVPAAAASVAPSVVARVIMKPLFTTSAGKRILLAASDLKPGTKAMEKLLARIPQVIGVNVAESPAPKATEPPMEIAE